MVESFTMEPTAPPYNPAYAAEPSTLLKIVFAAGLAGIAHVSWKHPNASSIAAPAALFAQALAHTGVCVKTEDFSRFSCLPPLISDIVKGKRQLGAPPPLGSAPYGVPPAEIFH